MATFNRRKAKSNAGLFPKVARLNKQRALQQAPLSGAQQSGTPTLRSRSIYLLPNAFTTANLFCRFFAIEKAMKFK